ncbi:methyl-accepting chemotaxis protein [Paenibacillus sp. GCM10028914]|uniref:methyl-accepting chemotaxis protein n=1 Tax=Paenibacillus sp. GCM10028914 TaxID=3273416 RepID=UPI00362370F0
MKDISKVEKKNALTQLKHMRVHPSKSVGARLFIIYFLSTLVFVFSLGLISYQMSKSTIQNNATVSNQQTVNQTAEKLELVLKRYEDSLQPSLFSKEVQDLVRRGSLESTDASQHIVIKQKLTEALGNWVFSNSGVVGVALIPQVDVMPNMTSGMVSDEFLRDVRQAAWFTEAMDAKQSLWMSDDGSTEEAGPSTLFRLAKALPGQAGKSYVIVADIKSSILTEELKKINMDGKSVVQLVSPSQRLIATSSDEGQDGYGQVLSDMQAELEKGSFEGKDTSGNEVLTVYSTLGAAKWKLMSVIPLDELMKDANKILLTTYLSVLIVTLIAIAIGIWMARTIAGPLVKMKGLMNEASKGNLKVRMEERSRDEIGDLSISFNEMMGQITGLVHQTNQTAIEVLETAQELSEASRRTADSAKEIAAATEQIASGASDLAGRADKGNDLADRMSMQIHQFIEVNRQMEDAAINVGHSSGHGIERLDALELKTDHTGQQIGALVTRVNGLKETTFSVLKILQVMQNITKQTNILSLNAAIEAARAGTAGKGFMVVADEIRGLANQSNQSIDMVTGIADEIMSEMNETVAVLSEVTPLFIGQRDAVKETNGIFYSVQEQMQSFIERLESVTASIDQLNNSQSVLTEAMVSVSAVAQQSSVTSEEVASLSGELQDVSHLLVELSGKLELASAHLKEKLTLFKL